MKARLGKKEIIIKDLLHFSKERFKTYFDGQSHIVAIYVHILR